MRIDSNQAISRTTTQLYRDCLRLARHIAGFSEKSEAIKVMMRSEFQKGKTETDPQKIEALKANAVRGLSNYLLYANAGKDERIKAAMTTKSEPKVQEAEWKAE